MTPEALQEQLRNFDQIATLVRQSGQRQTWRAVLMGQAVYVHFYPRQSTSRLGGSAAPGEFAGLTALQNANVPAVRAVALLSGFKINDRTGDAVITQGIEPLDRLDHLLESGQPLDRRRLLSQLIDLLRHMGKTKLGHRDLRLSSFGVSNGQLLLLDAAQIDKNGLKGEQLWSLAHDAQPHASAADRVRVWASLEPDAFVPRQDKTLRRRLRRLRSALPLRTFRLADWTVSYLESFDRAPHWSTASHLRFTQDQWKAHWPQLQACLDGQQGQRIKSDASGDIVATNLSTGGQTIAVIIKRPRNKFWYRHLLGFFRASRARRGFDRTIDLLLRHLPVETPLLVAERRHMGHVKECFAVYERVPGSTLDRFDLGSTTESQRASLFYHIGKLLRQIEQTGLAHTDAKSTNWIVYPHPQLGPQPVLIDAYGIRRLTSFLQLFGIRRVLKAMRHHPQYTPEDSRQLCMGFAPRASLVKEEEEERAS